MLVIVVLSSLHLLYYFIIIHLCLYGNIGCCLDISHEVKSLLTMLIQVQ